jgi:hypothetical protein
VPGEVLSEVPGITVTSDLAVIAQRQELHVIECGVKTELAQGGV